MEHPFVGPTGVRVSQLCMGTMSFGGASDEETSAALFSRCRDAGINCFDCADVYQEGRSEEILGRLIKSCRDEVVITTKAYFPTASDRNARGASRYHLVRAVDASLRRLDTDYIDLFYVHRFDDATALEETLGALDDLVRQGKVLYLAASNYAAWQVAHALGVQTRLNLNRFVCIQPMYNLAKRQAEVEILPMAQALGLGVMPYSPLGGGLFTGKYGKDRRPATGRLIENDMYRVRYAATANYEVAERFCALAEARGHHPAALAIAWVLAHPAVTAPIIGARDLVQLEPLLEAPNIDMSAELYDAIAALSSAPPPATDRNEETSEHNYGNR